MDDTTANRLLAIIDSYGPEGATVQQIEAAFIETHGPINYKFLVNRLSYLYTDRRAVDRMQRGLYRTKRHVEVDPIEQELESRILTALISEYSANCSRRIEMVEAGRRAYEDTQLLMKGVRAGREEFG